MIVADNQSSMKEDKFPNGMRVLAVDDDPICLKVLDTLLKKCHYHVTTTNQAVQALKMLRENKTKYDLVISDVNMPDMDGFKLLELVGLEMDLPVIMLSAHSDKDLVYKGVTHGAVDYLLKPVRIEELKNIWQHVVRRKKLHPNKAREDAVQALTSAVDQNGKGNNRRRKEHDEDEEDEDSNENEEAGSQKKPRVVWSVELHRKFVAAVNQLGIDKAVPKKILDLMNVEGLARENVASHLQKYRLYLKRLKNVVSQQKDSSYLRMASLDGFGDFRTMNGSGSLGNTSNPQGNMLGRLNSPSGLTLRGIASSGLLQPQNTTNTMNSLVRIQPALLPQSQSNTNIGSPTYSPVIIPQNQTKMAFEIQSSSINVPSLNPKCFNIPNDFDSSGFPVGPTVDIQGQTNYNYEAALVGNVNAGVFQHSDVENSALKPNTDYLEIDNYGTLDDIMNAIKRDPNGSILMDGEFEYDGYSLGSCF